jgi:spermidine synthase
MYTPIYFIHGNVVAESGNVKVYDMNNELFLEIGPGHNLWALESELEDYIQQLWDKPKGECLEIGLGLGIASSYILSCPKVESLTTVEKNEDIINTYDVVKNILNAKPRQKINFGAGKTHKILNAHGLYYAYETNKKYDFVFVDFYSVIDEDTIPEIADMVQACKRLLKRGGKIIGWYDEYTPSGLTEQFYNIFGKTY